MPQKKISFKHHLEYALFAALIFLIKHSPAWITAGERRTLVFFLKKAAAGIRG